MVRANLGAPRRTRILLKATPIHMGAHRMLFRYFFASTLYLVLGGPASVSVAADIEEHQLGEEINALVRPGAFSLHNDSPQKIVFFLSSQTNDRIKKSLAGNQTIEFSDGESSQYEIVLPTAHKSPVKYVISAQRRYAIYWNAKEERWDMFEIMAK